MFNKVFGLSNKWCYFKFASRTNITKLSIVRQNCPKIARKVTLKVIVNFG